MSELELIDLEEVKKALLNVMRSGSTSGHEKLAAIEIIFDRKLWRCSSESSETKGDADECD